MPGIQLDEIAEPARAAWASLRDRLRTILGDDLAAMWAHGGSTVVGDPPHDGDLDTYLLVSRPPDHSLARRVEEAEQALASQHGMESDTWYVLADDALRSDQPSHAWRAGRRDTSWAIHRAHWLAGRYANLHGAEPGDLVMAPTWDELRNELDRELEHIERHVVEGDTDPYEATYAILTGSRILRALATRDVVISKPAAGRWALEHLPNGWHAALRTALRVYHGQGTVEDSGRLAAAMSPFVEFVREHMPSAADRSPDALSRWSGY